MTIFNSSGPTGAPNGSSFTDATDAYANNGFTVIFERALGDTNDSVEFKAFIDGFQENYNCDWVTEQVYGRPDPIHMYKSTGRTISLGLLIPASTVEEGKENLLRVQRLIQFLYPSYIKANEAQTISESPLVRFKAMSLIGDRSDQKVDDNAFIGAGGSMGILAAITSLNVNHNLDNPDSGVFELAEGIIVPKLIEISVDMAIIHEHPVGWENNKFQTSAFPYMASEFSAGISTPDTQVPAVAPAQGAASSTSNDLGEDTMNTTSEDIEVVELSQAQVNNRTARLGGIINGMLQSRRCKKSRVITTSSSGVTLEGEKSSSTESTTYGIEGCDQSTE
tara:strand:+ start:16871 stop:17878 length:1008 start_codon:yes stop_codon:yes gene_type:complete